MSDFQDFPKMARLRRDCIITEKIDGTNAQVFIDEAGNIKAGSRTRYITPDDDNFGFAAWVQENAEQLRQLGPGRHFGEWWGRGIQRNYGLEERRFSLFNVQRWALHGTEPRVIPTADQRVTRTQQVLPPCVGLVPIMHWGLFSTQAAEAAIERLGLWGSVAAADFMKPEGIVVFHIAAGVGFKQTLEKDDQPKGARMTPAVIPYSQEDTEALRAAAAAVIEREARRLVAQATECGLVLTIEQVSRKPLAMGNYRSEVSLRVARGKV